jgi:hypothetical protein
MGSYLIPMFALWAVVAVAVLVLAVYRMKISNREDDTLHISDGETAVLAEQKVLATRLTAIDKWGKSLTIVAAVWGAALAGLFVYYSWIQNNASASTLQLIR